MKKIGKYQILGIIGKGGMGIVYKALDPDIEREVAIKTIRFDTLTESAEKEELLTRVIREAKAAGRLTHPNIITIYDVIRDKDLTYIVMQYVDGQSLQGQIDSGKAFSPQEIIDLLKPVADSLDCAHQNGIVHRDLKPANILIDKSGKPFLADFGVARIETSTLTQAGTTVGTLSYMSPEQVQGKQVDSRADIFALGVILYELLTGKKPFAGDNLSTIVYKIVHEEPPAIADIKKELPRGYESVIRRALAKNPDDRYQSGREMIADLENPGQVAEATLAYQTKLIRQDEPHVPPLKRRKELVLAMGIIGFVIVAGGGYLIFSGRPGKPPHLSENLKALKKEGVSPVTRSGGSAAGTGAPSVTSPGNGLSKLKETFETKDFQGTIKLAEGILGLEPANSAAQDYLKKARSEILATQTAPLLQSGISNYNSGNYSRCLQDMEKVLKLDKDNTEAQKYLFQADSALSQQDIQALIERIKIAEENKDLMTVLSNLDSPALISSLQSEYKLLFNGYDGIKSIISNLSINVPGRGNARATFSQLLTAVYKKDGKRKVVFEGTKTWDLKRQGKTWKITQIR